MTTDRDHHFMQQALELAAAGSGKVSPNPMVGAVLVKNDQVVGRGYHQALGRAHAEVEAIADAGPLAAGATLYVTLEPCNHTGRTPPCTQAILAARIARVVVAATDPNPDVQGGGIEFLKKSGLTVDAGIMAAEANRLNEAFVKHVQTKCPFVIAKWAATLDGRIATANGDARWVTGSQAREYVHRLRDRLDAIMVGVGTVQQDDPRLNTRLADGSGRDPVRVILDTRLTTLPTARLFQLDSPAQTLIICTPDAPARARRTLEEKGATVMTVPALDGHVDLRAAMQKLGAQNITSVLLEGGSRVHAAAWKAGVVDKVMAFYAPKLTGGDDGYPIFRGPGVERMNDCAQLENLQVRCLGEDVLIEGDLRQTSPDKAVNVGSSGDQQG